MYFRRRNWMKTKKKVFAGNWSHFFPKSGEDIKKKGLRWYLRPFTAGNLLDFLVLAGYFSSGHSALNSGWEDALISMGGAKSRWGYASPLQFK